MREYIRSYETSHLDFMRSICYIPMSSKVSFIVSASEDRTVKMFSL